MYESKQNSTTSLKSYDLDEALFELMNADIRLDNISFPKKAHSNNLTSYPNMSWKDAGVVRD